MKCPYCSTPVERGEWFCQNCKRTVPGQRTQPRRRGAIRWLAPAVVGVAVVIALLALLARMPGLPMPGISPAQADPASASAALSQAGHAAVTVLTVPPVKTFVYLNGGILLGEAPLRGVAIPAGKQRLVLWAPSIRGRWVRTVDVEPGGSALVVENMQGKDSFIEAP